LGHVKAGKRILPLQMCVAMKHALSVYKCNSFECYSLQRSIS